MKQLDERIRSFVAVGRRMVKGKGRTLKQTTKERRDKKETNKKKVHKERTRLNHRRWRKQKG